MLKVAKLRDDRYKFDFVEKLSFVQFKRDPLLTI